MNQQRAPQASGDTGSQAERAAGGGRSTASRLKSIARRGLRSGALPAVGAGLTVFGGARAFQNGRRGRGIAALAAGALLAALSVRLGRQASADEPMDFAVIGERDADDAESAGTDAEAAEAQTADAPADQAEPEYDEPTISEGETYERLGAAAFDEHSGEVPAPQRAFNQGELTLNAEAFWGVRDADGVVAVSREYDHIDERPAFRYVASTEVDDERMLRVPDEIRDHWDTLTDGGVAVVSGTDIVFVTSDAFADDSMLLVLPEQWADDVLGEEE
ncbi:hypothetical protein [Halomicrobium salinisoli]|uniref:hypothetical protein n=1 Tax=Halomicrobium salinisoli TaxID=2878391 RepID=UPI001CEFFA45|nr:hypothetical protein [Halomicrobium salinisoli]